MTIPLETKNYIENQVDQVSKEINDHKDTLSLTKQDFNNLNRKFKLLLAIISVVILFKLKY